MFAPGCLFALHLKCPAITPALVRHAKVLQGKKRKKPSAYRVSKVPKAR